MFRTSDCHRNITSYRLILIHHTNHSNIGPIETQHYFENNFISCNYDSGNISFDMSLNVLTVFLCYFLSRLFTYDKKCVYILPLMITTGKKKYIPLSKVRQLQYVSHKMSFYGNYSIDK